MKCYEKAEFPTAKIRQLLEPGPIVLVSSAWKGHADRIQGLKCCEL
jgi:hypothetical protein